MTLSLRFGRSRLTSHREQTRLNSDESQKHAMEVQLLDPEYLTRTIGFVNLVMAWLVRMADPKQQHPKIRVGSVVLFSSLSSSRADDRGLNSLPLPETTPEVLRFLPEFLIEDITEFLTFVSKSVLPRLLVCRND